MTKTKINWKALINAFESNVIFDMTKTIRVILADEIEFESNVIFDMTKTQVK